MHGRAGPTSSEHKPAPPARAWRSPELSLVIPTLDEHDNLEGLIGKLDAALAGIDYELIVVDDDSADGTAELAKTVAAGRPDLRCIRRVGRRGLASACAEGMSASAAPFVAVIDADHQHDESILPEMLKAARAGADLVIASRFAGGASTGEGLSPARRLASRFANAVTRFVTGVDLTDPMSGFFLLRRDLFDAVAPKLSPDGFKILLDIVVSAKSLGRTVKHAEVPYRFRDRHAGASKMNLVVAIHFFGLILSKLTGEALPSSFLLFALVGTTGVAVHLVVLSAANLLFGMGFTVSQLIATLVAMTSNFVLNNQITYAAQRLRGSAFWWGLLTFYGVCSFGTIANISVATWIYDIEPALYVAGLAGALMSVVFNYSVTRVFTWRRH